VIDAGNPTEAIDKALVMLHARPHYRGVDVLEGVKRLSAPAATGGYLKIIRSRRSSDLNRSSAVRHSENRLSGQK
jgi:hypothetical protein